MATFDILCPLFSTEETFLKALQNAYSEIEENDDEDDGVNMLCKCLTGLRGTRDVANFTNFIKIRVQPNSDPLYCKTCNNGRNYSQGDITLHC